jgi:hypothetical protein
MIRRRLEALERLPRRSKLTCQCILVYCPQVGGTQPPLDVVCDSCGLWRDPETTQLIEEVIITTREEAAAYFANQRSKE